ncbi:MAG: hypothetical protein IPJ45_03395 [Ignavibacteria bacterium]|nr:hypothetical protein [Ignavibacteria bacterium]
MKSNNILNPESGYTFRDLFDPLKLKLLTEDFYSYFEKKDKENFEEFRRYESAKGEGFTGLQISNVLINASVVLSDFLVKLFRLEAEQQKFFDEISYEKDILTFKKDFVQRRVFKKFKKEDLHSFDFVELDGYVQKLKQTVFADYDFAGDEEKYTAMFILELTELEKIINGFMKVINSLRKTLPFQNQY